MENKQQIIKLEDHKVYMASIKTDMVPYSIAVKAVEQVAESQTKEYIEYLQHSMKELHKTIFELQNQS